LDEYDTYKLAAMTQRSIISDAEKKGMERGMEKGMKEGIEKGMEKGMKEGMREGIKKGEQEKAVSIAQKD
jgi:flagellar biosynthesis/type III secretory pathway protein FliH